MMKKIFQNSIIAILFCVILTGQVPVFASEQKPASPAHNIQVPASNDAMRLHAQNISISLGEFEVNSQNSKDKDIVSVKPGAPHDLSFDFHAKTEKELIFNVPRGFDIKEETEPRIDSPRPELQHAKIDYNKKTRDITIKPEPGKKPNEPEAFSVNITATPDFKYGKFNIAPNKEIILKEIPENTPPIKPAEKAKKGTDKNDNNLSLTIGVGNFPISPITSRGFSPINQSFLKDPTKETPIISFPWALPLGANAPPYKS